MKISVLNKFSIKIWHKEPKYNKKGNSKDVRVVFAIAFWDNDVVTVTKPIVTTIEIEHPKEVPLTDSEQLKWSAVMHNAPKTKDDGLSNWLDKQEKPASIKWSVDKYGKLFDLENGKFITIKMIELN